jgi:hypothetical protein
MRHRIGSIEDRLEERERWRIFDISQLNLTWLERSVLIAAASFLAGFWLCHYFGK